MEEEAEEKQQQQQQQQQQQDRARAGDSAVFRRHLQSFVTLQLSVLVQYYRRSALVREGNEDACRCMHTPFCICDNVFFQWGHLR